MKILNWLFTLYRGRIRFEVPVLWAIGFMVTFVIGGVTGVLMAVPPADFVLHNSLFLVAHFHNVIIGGVLFGAMAGYNYWFPKAFGFTLDKRLGAISFWCWLVGFYLAFMPLYLLGLRGMTRRMQHYADKSWQPLLIVAEVGAVVILCGIIATIAQLVHSIRTRDRRRDLTGDPWQGRTLEWSTAPHRRRPTTSPSCQQVTGPRCLLGTSKQQASEAPQLPAPAALPLQPIEMPANSANGFITAFFAVLTGFALIWHIWWLALIGIVAALVTLFGFGWIERHGVEVTCRRTGCR